MGVAFSLEDGRQGLGRLGLRFRRFVAGVVRLRGAVDLKSGDFSYGPGLATSATVPVNLKSGDFSYGPGQGALGPRPLG
jgi:hypothetical protein